MASEPTIPGEFSGTPPTLDDLVVIGRIARPHGLKGEVRIFPETGCEDLLARIRRFYVETAEGLLGLVPRRVRAANRYAIVQFEGYHGRPEAERLRDKVLWVSPDELPKLPAGDVYQYTQLGAVVYDEAGQELGKVEEIADSAAHPVFRIVGPRGEFLFPAVESLIIASEVRDGIPVLVIRLPEGLIESQQAGGEPE